MILQIAAFVIEISVEIYQWINKLKSRQTFSTFVMVAATGNYVLQHLQPIPQL